MDDPALQSRLDTIARRQSYVLGLLVAGYLIAGAWLLVATVPSVTVWTAGFGVVVLAVLASTVGVYRRRTTTS
jgi:hypothetical protein